MKNFVPLPYRRVAVRNKVDFPLTESALREHLLGHDAYRRTEFVVLHRGSECAVARIEKANDDASTSFIPAPPEAGARSARQGHGQALFSPITRVEFLAPPGECHWADDASVDVGNPSQLAAKARALGLTRDHTLIVHGKYEHVNFIVHPEPIVVRVVDVIPPEPAKLWTMVNQVLTIAEDLPPIELRYEPIDLIALARAQPASEYLFPCQASGIEVGAPTAERCFSIHFLDTRPAPRDWTMIGCERCMQMHRNFYNAEPEVQVDFCPRTQLARAGWLDGSFVGSKQPTSNPTPSGAGRTGNQPTLTLTKCCLFEFDNEYDGDIAIVPWGGNLRHVEAALRYLVKPVQLIYQQRESELADAGDC